MAIGHTKPSLASISSSISSTTCPRASAEVKDVGDRSHFLASLLQISEHLQPMFARHQGRDGVESRCRYVTSRRRFGIRKARQAQEVEHGFRELVIDRQTAVGVRQVDVLGQLLGWIRSLRIVDERILPAHLMTVTMYLSVWTVRVELVRA